MTNLYVVDKLQDIKATQQNLWQQYQQFFVNKDIRQLPQFLEAHPELKQCLLNAENWNKLIKSISDKGFVTVWNSTTAYNIGDLVIRSGFPNSVYACIKANTNTQPAVSPLFWEELESIGGVTYKSIEGMWEYDYFQLYNNTNWRNFKWVGEWSSSGNYVKNNIVTKTYPYTTIQGTTLTYQVIWVCLQNNVGQPLPTLPTTQNAYWLKMLENADSIGIQVSPTQPTNCIAGDIYFKTII